ncbi:MAG TPA: GTPase-activating protein [Alteromonas sp.]|jgi:ribosome assembly protein YihI (activator of Der GTPase)|nr:GTPase-activating protein [Alteromonas sp.]HCA75999.1 GTPase-activating protein [Alteromonas sp.]HCB08448.1 GTPase-activating protein [Alteromonas sp.]HCB18510.1 GTPase-activating protein [Alteromonas sp.]HCL12688.1 GTPase-activating protein [Alteromonas sp.]|tara:strand:+ start:275 stop:763 length:489 start_codon:yes stop_codon:yes gene_type:complete
MAKKKKSRKVGLIGVRKNPDHVNTKSSERPKKHKGKAPGSRHNVEQKKADKAASNSNKDPRLGSKKPVPLIKSVPAKIEKRKFATPAEELAAIEADDRLASLLDKLDDGEKITKEQQHYVDTTMARHKVLCDLMGISDDEDEEDEIDELDALDALKLDDYEK